MRTEKNRVALAGVSINAARAFEAVTAPEFVPLVSESNCFIGEAALDEAVMIT